MARPFTHKNKMNAKTLHTNKPAEPTKAEPVSEFRVKLGTKQFVRTHSGQMVHLFTNAVFSVEPRRAVVDDFLVAQLEANKLFISEE